MNHSARISAVRRRMRALMVPGILAHHLQDVRYLSGFTGSSAALAIAGRAARLFTDGRYIAQAAEEVQVPQIKVEIASSSPTVAAAQWLAAQAGVDSIGFDAARTTVAELARWKAALPAKLRGKLLKPLKEPIVELLRQVKDEEELAAMREAAQLGCRLFDHILGILEPGMTEIAVAAELEHKARLWGAEAMSFDTIVAAGERSALPHGRASPARLPRSGFVTLDFGVILKGYCSDMTRTVSLGKLTGKQRSAYEAVLLAQESAVAAVVAGAAAGDVDEAARGVLREAGMAEAFSHSTGHGVGLEIHESPRIAAGQKTILAPGMAITIEPGVYFAGEFGIRIEDTVAVTRSGCEILTPSPKTLIEL